VLRLFRRLLGGAAAGAAGTAALDAVTYMDMAWRGRPASSTPQQAAEKLAKLAGHPIRGQAQVRDNRLVGLGSLQGIAAGAAVGAIAGATRPLLTRLGPLVSPILIGAAAMALSDGVLAQLDVAHPTDWSAVDWATDVVPHLAFGVVAYATLSEMQRPRAPSTVPIQA
jgi:hypothetical protein